MVLSQIWGNQLLSFYPFKLFEGCLPQILLDPFLNTLPHICINSSSVANFTLNMYFPAESYLQSQYSSKTVEEASRNFTSSAR